MRSSSATPRLPTAAAFIEANRVCAPKTIPLRIGRSAGHVNDWLIGAATNPTLPQFCNSMTPPAPPESGCSLEVDLCVPTATAAVVRSVAIAATKTKRVLIIVPSHTRRRDSGSVVALGSSLSASCPGRRCRTRTTCSIHRRCISAARPMSAVRSAPHGCRGAGRTAADVVFHGPGNGFTLKSVLNWTEAHRTRDSNLPPAGPEDRLDTEDRVEFFLTRP